MVTAIYDIERALFVANALIEKRVSFTYVPQVEPYLFGFKVEKASVGALNEAISQSYEKYPFGK